MLFFIACSSEPSPAPKALVSPSDDPAEYDVDTSVSYRWQTSALEWIVPSSSIPPELEPMPSNNNVELHFFEGKLYFAWRSAPTHFASEEAKMWIISLQMMDKHGS